VHGQQHVLDGVLHGLRAREAPSPPDHLPDARRDRLEQVAAGAGVATLGEWFDALREWLAGFPLSTIQLAGRIGVGAVFFKAGLGVFSVDYLIERQVARRYRRMS
jgi:hypothetical protein